MIVYSSKSWKIAEESTLEGSNEYIKSTYVCYVSKKVSKFCPIVRYLNNYIVVEKAGEITVVNFEVIECLVVNSH